MLLMFMSTKLLRGTKAIWLSCPQLPLMVEVKGCGGHCYEHRNGKIAKALDEDILELTPLQKEWKN